MDIRFACDNCGQHLVVDEAAAGLTIQCSTCGTNLTVPEAHPASPTLSAAPIYRELYDQSRGLAYELRGDDAIRVWQQAEEARARERGYQLHEGFRFQDSAQSVLEQARWAVKQSLRHLVPLQGDY